ncbi:HEAT repeat domain-containing protein [Kitasatospora sp. NPDC085879]|uniref:HEAT repeat domain-containing protein n=1 Tax=Kitasatospora sp. NPDC085879 TaxID=3154769 RepID=UPI00342811D7
MGTEQQVDGLIEQLRCGAGDGREAVDRLVSAGEPVVPALLAALPGFDRSGRAAVGQVLRGIGPAACRVAVEVLTGGGTPPTTWELTAVLDMLDDRCSDELTGLLRHPLPQVRSAALHALGALGRAGAPAVLSVLPLLADGRDSSSAERALRAMGPGIVPELLAVRAAGPGRLRRHALHALAALGACDRLTERDRRTLERLVRIKLIDDRRPDPDWDYHWVAVPGDTYEGAFEVLGLHDRIPATLAMGVSGRIHDEAVVPGPDGTGLTVNRVFVTPEIAGWRLLFGGILVNCPDEGVLELLAERCGQACYFGRDGYDDEHLWAVAERGRGIVRSYATYREPAWTGEPLPWEEPQTADPQWEPGLYEPNASLESDSQAVAARLCVDPEDIGDDTPMTGHGWFALTAPGVGHGVFPGVLSI